jgi:predicted nucleotidyltransferase component of viral defense system
MKLHRDTDAFGVLLEDIWNREKIRTDIAEKDYYVTLVLKELAQNQAEWKAYFKGGTALYKALHGINRFSEDIDLTVFIHDCPSNNAKKKRLELSAEGYNCLERISSDKSRKGSIVTIYRYDSMYGLIEDELQRFEKVKIEATSFTVSEPTQTMTIAPVIYDKATKQQKEILENQFDVMPFTIETMKLERIFIDKVFAAEFYYSRGEYLDTSKHIYDLIIMFDNIVIKELLNNSSYLLKIISYKRLEEEVRAGGVPAQLPICDFTYLKDALSNSHLLSEYQKMQRLYIFIDKDRRPLENVKAVFNAILKIKE